MTRFKIVAFRLIGYRHKTNYGCKAKLWQKASGLTKKLAYIKYGHKYGEASGWCTNREDFATPPLIQKQWETLLVLFSQYLWHGRVV